MPSEIDPSDIAESMYAYIVSTELTWSAIFSGTWAAWEGDVIIQNLCGNKLYSTLSITHGRRVLSVLYSEESMLLEDTLQEKRDALLANCVRLLAQHLL